MYVLAIPGDCFTRALALVPGCQSFLKIINQNGDQLSTYAVRQILELAKDNRTADEVYGFQLYEVHLFACCPGYHGHAKNRVYCRRCYNKAVHFLNGVGLPSNLNLAFSSTST